MYKIVILSQPLETSHGKLRIRLVNGSDLNYIKVNLNLYLKKFSD